MNLNAKSVLTNIVRRQEGQVLPWLCFMLVSFAGVTAFVVDVGRGIVAYHMLQASCDAAAMAAVQVLPSAATSAQVTNQATLFSSVAGNYNANPTLLPNVSMQSGYPMLYCSATGTNIGVSCVGPSTTNAPTGTNAVTVAQTARIPTLFAEIVGVPNFTVSAASSALMAGSTPQKYNIAVILDTTASMGSSDPGGCPGKKLTAEGCAQLGLQTLLAGLQPCTSATSNSSSTCAAYDAVSLFTFPSVNASTTGNATTCNGGSPSVMAYPTPVPAPALTPGATTWTNPDAVSTSTSSATYQVTGYLSNWSNNNQPVGSTGTFNSSSGSIAIPAGGASGCKGMGNPGGDGTWLPGAIYAAAASLQAQQLASPGSKNALIILSDGDQNTTTGKIAASNGETLNKTGTYPSLDWQCHQGITAAQYASAMTDANGNPDTTVFTIAYNASGSSSSSCGTDGTPPDYPTVAKNPISACTEMLDMASSTATAFADSSSSCTGGQTIGALPAIFTKIKTEITFARLLPAGS